MLTDFRKQGKDVFGTIIIPTTPAKRREQVPVDTEAQLYTETHNCCDSTYKPGEAQARPNPNMKREGKHTFPPTAQKLLATSSCWERKRSFSQKL